MPLTLTIKTAIVASYRDYLPRIRDLTEGLSDEQVWTRPYPYGNSMGHLLLHLSGNLNAYIGAGIAGSGYVRDREREFGETERLPLVEVRDDLERAVAMVTETLEGQSDDELALPFAALGRTPMTSRLHVFLHCSAHLHHHIGQMIYLRKALLGVGVRG
jgi:uncharacterized damage-inducible protein DinB